MDRTENSINSITDSSDAMLFFHHKSRLIKVSGSSGISRKILSLM